MGTEGPTGPMDHTTAETTMIGSQISDLAPAHGPWEFVLVHSNVTFEEQRTCTNTTSQ